MPAIVISMSNLKGGVGKSSTTLHLAGTLAREGSRVAVIDADPQASLTQGFFGPDETRAIPRHRTIAAYFADGLTPAASEIVHAVDEHAGIYLLAGSRHLASFNVPDPHLAPMDQQRALVPFVQDLREEMDFILIDTAPTLSLCTWAALTASDGVVVPLQAEDFGSQGIADVLDSIEAIQAQSNPGLRLLGYLLTMFNPKLAIHQTYEATLRRVYGDQVFTATIPIATHFKEAVASRRSIAKYKPTSVAAKSIKAFADELRERAFFTVKNHSRGAA